MSKRKKVGIEGETFLVAYGGLKVKSEEVYTKKEAKEWIRILKYRVGLFTWKIKESEENGQD